MDETEDLVTHWTARTMLEISESALLGCLEPRPVSGCYVDELPRVRRAILRARDGALARFRRPVNRNSFLVGCGEFTANRRQEHLVVGYGFRHGFLLDNLPIASHADRRVLESRALNPKQLLRRLMGQGRVLFYLGENGYVREFRIPSVIGLLDRARD